MSSDRERLSELNDALAAGATNTSVDGVGMTIDLKHLRREKYLLEVKLGIRKRRRRVFALKTGDG